MAFTVRKKRHEELSVPATPHVYFEKKSDFLYFITILSFLTTPFSYVVTRILIPR